MRRHGHPLLARLLTVAVGIAADAAAPAPTAPTVDCPPTTPPPATPHAAAPTAGARRRPSRRRTARDDGARDAGRRRRPPTPDPTPEPADDPADDRRPSRNRPDHDRSDDAVRRRAQPRRPSRTPPERRRRSRRPSPPSPPGARRARQPTRLRAATRRDHSGRSPSRCSAPVQYANGWGDCRDGCARRHVGHRHARRAHAAAARRGRRHGHPDPLRERRHAGNGITITGADGWYYNYFHVNNDTPGHRRRCSPAPSGRCRRS